MRHYCFANILLTGHIFANAILRTFSFGQPFFEPKCSRFLEARQHMAVNIQRHLDTAMAQALRDDLRVNLLLKPYMRYTLAGGTNYVAENVSGSACQRDPLGSYIETPVLENLEETHDGLMESPGHRDNILDPWHKRVSLGIACDAVTCSVVQLFERDYVDFTATPRLSTGTLHTSGFLSNEFELVQIQIWYDQPPQPLTFGQLGQTFSYGAGQIPLSFVRKPLSGGYTYTEDSTEFSWESGTDPYLVGKDTPQPVLGVSGFGQFWVREIGVKKLLV